MRLKQWVSSLVISVLLQLKLQLNVLSAPLNKTLPSLMPKCSSVVRAFTHDAMGRRIDSLSYFRSSQCSTTGVTKAVVCVILSVGWCI